MNPVTKNINEDDLLSSIFGEDKYVPNGIEGKLLPANVFWGWCNMCEVYLKCPKCGNNLCNGGSGYLDKEHTIKCDLCVSMYSLQDFLIKTKQYPTKDEFIKAELK